jgi:predicted permease
MRKERVMTNLVMLFVCLAAGMLLRVTNRLPDNAHTTINGFIINVALPALILAKIHNLHLSTALVWPVLMPWILFALGTVLFVALARLLRLSKLTTGALILTAGLGNTSFVGLPMIQAFYGPGQLATGILIDQLGTYLVLSTAGITVACLFSSSTAPPREIALRIAKFPPLIALAIALATNALPDPAWLTGLFGRLGDTLAPLALVSVGFQLKFKSLRGCVMPLSLGLIFKLLFGPAIIALLYLGVLARGGEMTQVTLFEAAMGPQIGGAVVAMQYGFDPALITLMVGIGITLSFLTLPLWYLVLAPF